MQLSEVGESLIKSFEKLELEAYHGEADPDDVWTIGWGHTGPEVKPGMTITAAEADALFDQDVADFVAAVNRATNEDITTQSQFDALVSFTYNLGVGNLQASSVLRLHNSNQPMEAARVFTQWISSAGQKRRGLLLRRLAEASLYAADRFIITGVQA